MATKFSITDAGLKALKPKEKTYTKHFGGGFYVSVLPNGRKVCRYCYQADGKRRRFELGEYHPSAGAVKYLGDEYKRVHLNRTINGIDPAAEQEKRDADEKQDADNHARMIADEQAAKLADETRVTLTQVCERFKDKYTGASSSNQIARSTKRTYAWILDKYVIPEFGHHPLDDLPEDEILDYIDKVAETRPTAANQLHAVMSAMFKWATKQRRYNNPKTGGRKFRRNPLAGVDRPAPKVKRKRVLDFAVKHKRFTDNGEIKRFWNWLNTINQNHADAFRVILLTGIRATEALSLQREDVFADQIVIPAAKMKGGRDIHTIPYTPQLKAVMDSILAQGATDYLFVPRIKANQRKMPHVRSGTISADINKAQCDGGALADIEHFCTHDLRRTVATHVGDAGFSPADLDLLLHHAQGGVVAHYNYSDPVEKKLAMLTAWHNRLDSLIHGKEVSNVVAING